MATVKKFTAHILNLTDLANYEFVVKFSAKTKYFEVAYPQNITLVTGKASAKNVNYEKLISEVEADCVLYRDSSIKTEKIIRIYIDTDHGKRMSSDRAGKRLVIKADVCNVTKASLTGRKDYTHLLSNIPIEYKPDRWDQCIEYPWTEELEERVVQFCKAFDELLERLDDLTKTPETFQLALMQSNLLPSGEK